jgi:hypothetical protein
MSTLISSLYNKYTRGEITIREVAIELHKYGRSNFIDEKGALEYMNSKEKLITDMRLLSEKQNREIESKYPLGSQDGKKGNAICVAKFFLGNYTWYITEGSYEDDDFMMFGVVVTDTDTKFSYISYNELQSLRMYGYMCVERDRYFDKCNLSEIKDDMLQKFLKQLD